MPFVSILSLLKIIVIDLIMSGDNAIVIAMATKNLPKKVKKKAMYRGIIGAAILRITLASLATYVLQFQQLKLLGGILLFYIARNFFKQLKLGYKKQKIKAHNTVRKSIGVIILADISLGLDNVLAVASIAENIWILMIGLVASISMIVFATNTISHLIKKHERIMRTGLLIILHASVEIIFGTEIAWNFSIPLSWIVLIIALIIATYLYIRNITHVEFHVRRHHLHNYTRFFIIGINTFILSLSFWIPSVHAFLMQYENIMITSMIVSYVVLLELIMQQRAIDHHKMLHQSRH